jgi:hypothetical protein
MPVTVFNAASKETEGLSTQYSVLNTQYLQGSIDVACNVYTFIKLGRHKVFQQNIYGRFKCAATGTKKIGTKLHRS